MNIINGNNQNFLNPHEFVGQTVQAALREYEQIYKRQRAGIIESLALHIGRVKFNETDAEQQDEFETRVEEAFDYALEFTYKWLQAAIGAFDQDAKGSSLHEQEAKSFLAAMVETIEEWSPLDARQIEFIKNYIDERFEQESTVEIEL